MAPLQAAHRRIARRMHGLLGPARIDAGHASADDWPLQSLSVARRHRFRMRPLGIAGPEALKTSNGRDEMRVLPKRVRRSRSDHSGASPSIEDWRTGNGARRWLPTAMPRA